MFEVWKYSLVSVFIVSLVSLTAVFSMPIKIERLKQFLIYMISFSAGALLGDAFLHLLPEAVEEFGFGIDVSLYVLAGVAFSFIVEKIIHWRHCHHLTTDDHPHPFAIMNLFGDSVHNFLDGLIIGASYLVSVPVGVATTIAVVMHEIPQEIGDFGVLLHGGFSKRKAVFLNFIVSLFAFAGVVGAIIFSSFTEGLTGVVVPFAVGSFIYIAGADLIPELHKEVAVGRSVAQFMFFALGVGLMVALKVVG
jgi:zinc and cadmium transporter